MKMIKDSSENMLLDVLDEALEARIVAEPTEEIGLYRFTHAQIQQTLRSELSANRLVRSHAQIAAALEEFYGGNAEVRAAELVEHFAEAEVLLGTEKIVRYGLAAGERSIGAFAYEAVLDFMDPILELPVVEGGIHNQAWALEASGLSRTALSVSASTF